MRSAGLPTESTVLLVSYRTLARDFRPARDFRVQQRSVQCSHPVMAHFARALQRCSKVAGVAATSVATATFCDAAINKKDFTPLIVARNDKIGANVHKVTLAFPAVHQSNCHRHC